MALVILLAGGARAGFVDVSDDQNIIINDVTYGLGWGDLEQDGDPDLFIVRHYFRPLIYRNLGSDFNHSFFPPLFQAQDHHGAILADLDDDGDLDIYLTAGSDGGFGSVAKKMYRNDGNYSFENVAFEWGLRDSLARGRSISAMDLEGDGDVDLFVAKAPRVDAPNSLYINDGSPSFTDMAASAGLADAFGSVGGIWGDYDRDGDADLFIGGEEDTTYQSRLYRNDGGLSFTNVTATAFPDLEQVSSAAWGDYDEDGDLDLAVGLGDQAHFDAVSWNADSLTFFFNTRGPDTGVDGFGFTQTGDSATYKLFLNGFYDNEAIYISATGYHPGLVTPFTLGFDEQIGTPPFTPGQSVGIYLWTETLADTWQVRTNTPPIQNTAFAGAITTNGSFTGVSTVDLEPYEHGERGTRLYRNEGDGTFLEVTTPAGLSDTVNVRHVTWIDVNLDGNLDLHVLNKGDTADRNQPNLLYLGVGSGFFVEASGFLGLEGPSEGLADACAFEDYDQDGDPDLAIVSGAGPRFFGLLSRHALFRNDGPTGNWLRLDLQGTASTGEGLGCWVTCVSASAGRQSRYVTGNAWRGSPVMRDPLFGLGGDAVVDSVIVEWPMNFVSLYTNVPANQTLTIVEGADPASEVPGVDVSRPGLRLSIRPNPTAGRTTFHLAGRGEGEATVDVFDAAGRRVWSAAIPPGVSLVEWDGRDSGGARVSPGVYFTRARDGRSRAEGKVVVLE